MENKLGRDCPWEEEIQIYTNEVTSPLVEASEGHKVNK